MKNIETFDIKLLKLPKKIDFYNYSTYTGGEFFTSMIALSCNHTKKVLRDDVLCSYEITQNKIVFSKNEYNKPIKIYSWHDGIEFLPANEIINLYKYSILNHMIPESYNLNNLKKYKNIIFIFSGHWNINPQKMKDISEYEYWNFLDLNPKSNYSHNILDKMHNILKINKTPNPKIENKYPFLENFPFLDYILDKDYPGIKDWIENRYGSDLDFDFIDRSLRMWKKVRVDPYL
jgi:hypothetical protein